MQKLYGFREIADASGIDYHLLHKWHQRGKMPKPDQVLAMGPVWTARRIEPWIQNLRGRPEYAAV